MNMRNALAGSVITAALLLAACHKGEKAAADASNAVDQSANLADTNANDEMMNEDMGNSAVANGG